MAAGSPPSPQPFHPPRFSYVKSLAESPALTSIPSAYTFTNDPNETQGLDPQHDSIPIIDFSLLTSANPRQRTTAIQHLHEACQQWGFFTVINHGVPESLMKAIIDGCKAFFDQTEEEKGEFEGSHVLSPIRCGTSFNTRVEQVFCWRDFLKVFAHPQFHFPHKPAGFSGLALEYTQRIRELVEELLKGISESLGLEDCYIVKAMNMESSFQVFIANLYPPCPQPQHAMGLPSHSDHGLLTFLIQNEVNGLQVEHNGNWFNVHAIPNSFLVNTGDQLEILSNGKYKSVLHRAVVNEKATRISLAIGNGPSLDTVVAPLPELVDSKSHPPTYVGTKYEEYLALHQGNKLDAKSCLDRVRL